MRNVEQWTPSKVTFDERGATPSTDRKHLAVSSRLATALFADFYARTIPAYASGLLLDLGCGTQPFFALYRHKVTRATAVDWPQSYHSSPHLDVYADLTKPLPLASETFDTVLFSDVLEHLPTPQQVFTEIARILRPGGVLLLNTPFLYPVHEAPHDYLRHTRYSLQRCAEEAGLEVVELVEIGGALDVLFDIVSKLLSQVPVAGTRLAGLLQHVLLRRRQGALTRRLRARSAAYFPLGHSMVARKPLDAAS